MTMNILCSAAETDTFESAGTGPPQPGTNVEVQVPVPGRPNLAPTQQCQRQC